MSIRELLAADTSRGPEVLPVPATPGPPLANHQDEWEVDWRRTLSAVTRIKWWVLLLAALGGVGGLIVGRLRPAVYAAQATIWIDGATAANGGGVDRGPFRPGRLLDTDAWLDLLRSYVVLDDVTRRERLFLSGTPPSDSGIMAGFDVTEQYRPGNYKITLTPANRGAAGTYTLSTGDGIPLDQGRLGDSVGVRLGFRWAPAAGGLPPLGPSPLRCCRCGTRRACWPTASTPRSTSKAVSCGWSCRDRTRRDWLRSSMRWSSATSPSRRT